MTACSTEVNKYGCNNIALVLLVSVQSSSNLMMSAAENRWNFQYSQYAGPVFYSIAQPLHSTFWAFLFLAFMALSSNCCHTYTQECIHTRRFCTFWGKWKGSKSIFSVLKSKLISVEGNEVQHLLSKGCWRWHVRQTCIQTKDKNRLNIQFHLLSEPDLIWFGVKTHIDFSDASLHPYAWPEHYNR